MTPTAPQVQRFFSDYATAAQGTDPERLARLYAPTFIVAGPQGSQAFANDDAFLEWLRGVRAANLEAGMQALTPEAIDTQALSPVHALATVTWSTQFAKAGDTRIRFRIAYLLETAPELKILAYVSEADEAAEKQRLGL